MSKRVVISHSYAREIVFAHYHWRSLYRQRRTEIWNNFRITTVLDYMKQMESGYAEANLARFSHSTKKQKGIAFECGSLPFWRRFVRNVSHMVMWCPQICWFCIFTLTTVKNFAFAAATAASCLLHSHFELTTRNSSAQDMENRLESTFGIQLSMVM